MALDIVAWGAITFGLAVATQLVFFIPATFFKTDKLTDFSGSLGFFILALAGLLWPSDYFARQIVLCSLQMLWAIRLGAFLTTRVLNRGKDDRFDEIRSVWWKWALFWSTQVTWVWVVSLPVTFIVATHTNKALSAVDYVGWSIFGLALLIETVADYQKLSFNKSKQPGEKKFIQAGLWRNSRHPNYFGEIFVWLGIWLSSSYGLWDIETAYGVLGLFSPVFTFVLLAFVSGIPPSEKRDDKRFGDMPEYVEYKKRTSPLWFFPCSLYAKMPMLLRKVPFVDIYDYTKLQNRPAENEEQPADIAPAANEEENALKRRRYKGIELAGTPSRSVNNKNCTYAMLPLVSFILNTTVFAPLAVKYLLQKTIDYDQILDILAIATGLNFFAVLGGHGVMTPKNIGNAVGGLAIGLGLYYLVAVIFGAYLVHAYERTFVWALWMSSMTIVPLALKFGIDLNRWHEIVIRRDDHGSKEESRLICGIYSIWVGSWASCIVIPLDWDRPWQRWPVPNVVGALLLSFTTSVGFLLKDMCKCCGKDSKSAKTGKSSTATVRSTPSKIPVKKTPLKNSSPMKAAAPSTPKTPTRKTPLAAGRTRSRSPSKSPTKQARDVSPKKVPSTPKSRSKVATPAGVRASSRLAKRTRDL